MTSQPKSPGLATRRAKQRRRNRLRGIRPRIERLEPRVMLDSVSWDGGGDVTSWHDPLNWDTDQLPESDDDVTIDYPGNITVVHSSGDTSINSLLATRPLTLSGGSLTVATTVRVDNDFVLSGGNLVGATVLPGSGGQGIEVQGRNAVLDGVTLDADIHLVSNLSRVTIMGGLELNAAAQLGGDSEEGQLWFAGTQTLGGTGEVIFGARNQNHLYQVTTGETLTIGPEITVRGRTGRIGHPSLDVSVINHGTIVADVPGQGSLDIRIEGTFTNLGTVQTTNNGVITIENMSGMLGQMSAGTGLLNLNGAYENNLVLNVAGESSALTLEGDWTNTGTINVVNSTVNLGGLFTVADIGDINSPSGTVNLTGTLDNALTTLKIGADSGTWNLTDGTIRGGTVMTTDGATLNVPYVRGRRATLDGVTIEGHLNVTPDEFQRTPVVDVINGFQLYGTAHIDGTLVLDGNQVIGGRGQFIIKTGGFLLKDTGTTLTVASGITLQRTGQLGRGLPHLPSDVTLINEGTFAPEVMTINALQFVNRGAIIVNRGNLDINGSLTAERGSVLSSQVPGRVSISGDLLGDIDSPDQFGPAGTTILDGNGTEASPQLLEVVSRDAGPVAAGFDGNFAFALLELDNGTYVQLVDRSDNAAGSDPEALYVNQLRVAGGTLDLNGLSVYARAIDFNSRVVGGVVELLPDGGPLSPGVLTPGEINEIGEVDEWTFFGRGGRTVTAVVQPGRPLNMPAPIVPLLTFGGITLLDPQGNTLAAEDGQGNRNATATASLPIDGTYTVQVRASSWQSGRTGNYFVSISDSTADVRPLILNQPYSGRIETPYNVDQWNFTALAGQQIQFDLLNDASDGIQFTLTGPNGWTGFQDLGEDSELISLTESGRYTLTAVGTTSASYRFVMNQFSFVDLSLGTPYQGSLAATGQAQLFRLTVPESETLRVLLDDESTSSRNELYVKFDAPPTRRDYDHRYPSPGADQGVLVPVASPGTWYILLYADHVAQPSDYTLATTTSGLAVGGITPDQLGNGDDMLLTIRGAGFDSTTLVELVAPDTKTYAADRIEIDLPTQMTVTFAAGSVPPDLYSIRASMPGGVDTRLDDALAVVAGGEAKLETNVVLPRALGRHAPATIYVEYANTGDLTMPAPVLVLQATDRGLMTLDHTLVGQGFWSSGKRPDGFGDSVQFLATGETPGSLGPGETYRVPVYWVGMERPWDTSDTLVEFNLTAATVDDTSLIDWAELEDQLQPTDADPEVWAAIWSNVAAQVGDTWGDFVRVLNDSADYLGRLGQRVVDISSLFGFELAQADGLGPIQRLDSNLDATVGTPGLPLNLGRSFPNSISGRYQEGSFGRGWQFPWDRSLRVEPDGIVFISGPGGSERRFQPDLRGGFLPAPGDFGELTRHDNGTHTIEEPSGVITRFRSDGKIDYVEDSNDNRITAHYTGELLTRLAHSAGQFLDISRNAAGLIDSVTDSDGRQTVYTYDAANEHLMTVEAPDGLVTRYSYSIGAGPVKERALTSIELPSGVSRDFSYDDRGRLAEISFNDGELPLRFTYDSAGGVTVSDAEENAAQSFFDHRGMLVKIVDPLRNGVYVEYDDALRLTRLTDPSGLSYEHMYGADGNLSQSTDPLGQTTLFTYGPFDRLASRTDPNGNVTQYRHADFSGNLASTMYADGSVEFFTYDAQGNARTTTNRRGNTITFEYNAAGQVERKTYPDNTEIVYTYEMGNLVSVTDGRGTITFNYENDRLTDVTYPGGRFLGYDYDEAGRRTQMVDQDGFTVNYVYDDLGRLETLTDANDELIVRYMHDMLGRLERKELGNNTYTTYDYDAAGRVLEIVNRAPDDAVNSQFEYTYDPHSLVETMTTRDGQWTYEHNETGQLTSAVFASTDAAIPDQNRQYEYDALGNRVRTIRNGVETVYAPNKMNQYTQVGTKTWRYDDDGNLISVEDGGEVEGYVYDLENRLVSVTTPDGVWTYEYDALGNRIASVHDGQRTEYLLDPTGLVDVVAEYDGSGNVVVRYTHGLGLTSRVDASGEAYYDFDLIGSTVGLSKADGKYVNSYSYLPFGEQLASDEVVNNPFGYVGQFGVMREGTGLEFMRARYYAPADGRFLTEDPIDLAGGDNNYYRYVFNSPLNLSDPAGLQAFPFRGDSGYDPAGLNTAADIASIGAGAAWVGLGAFAAAATGAVAIPATAALIGGGLIGLGLGNLFPPLQTGGGDLLCDALDCDEAEEWPPSQALPGGGSVQPIPVPPWRRGGGPAGGPGGSPIPPGGPGGGGGTPAANAIDPNQKLGPGGFGAENYFRVDSILPYRVDFENDPEATAPAQRVDVTDQLSASLDWTTLEFTEVGFGDELIAVPPGSQYFGTTVEMTFNDQDFEVEIELEFDNETGEIHASFQSIEPVTGLPPGVLTGFLPPEDGTGRGQGYFSYIINADQGLASGTEVRNVAIIRFDFGEIIATNQIDPHDPSQGTDPSLEALVTLDVGRPNSSVMTLPGVTSSKEFLVQWSGQDDPGGSGIASFDVYVSDNGGPFELWLGDTTVTAALFEGEELHTYGFYSVARDNVGRVQPTPIGSQAATTVDTPPTVMAVVRNDDTDSPGELTSLTFHFSEDVSASLSLNDLVVTDQTTGMPVELTGAVLDAATGRWDVSALSLPPARYSVALLAAGVEDAAGNLLDGNDDGLGGDDHTTDLLVALPGDANLDGKVDAADLNIVALNWRMPGAGWGNGDFTKDGLVNAADLNALALHWRQDTFPSPAAAAGPIEFISHLPRAPLPRRISVIDLNSVQHEVQFTGADSISDDEFKRWNWYSPTSAALPFPNHPSGHREAFSQRSENSTPRITESKTLDNETDEAWHKWVDMAISDWPRSTICTKDSV